MVKKIVLAAVVFYTLFGFFALPAIIKSQLERIVTDEMNAKLSIENITFNPFAFTMEIKNVSLLTLEDKTLASFELLSANVEPHSLFYKALHIKNITLQKPQIFLIQNKDKSINFEQILKPKKAQTVIAQENNSKPMRIILDALRIREGLLSYEDYTKSTKFEFASKALDVKIESIDTHNASSSKATIRLTTTLSDGATIDFRGNIKGFEPVVTEGSLKLDSLKLYSVFKYIQDSFDIEVADGALSLDAKYHFNMSDINSTKIDNLSAALENLRVKPKHSGGDIVTLKSLKIDDALLLPLLRDVSVKDISLDALNVNIKRDEKGEIDFLAYMKSNDAKADGNQTISKEEARPWNILLEGISAKKISATLSDATLKPVVQTKLNELNFNLKNVTLEGEKPFAYSLDFLINNSFRCGAKGDIIHKVPEINSEVNCTDLNMLDYVAYADNVAIKNLKTYNVLLKSLMASFDFNINLKKQNEEMQTTLNNANLSLDNFSLSRRDNDKKVVDFKKFAIYDAYFSTATKELSIDKIALDGFSIFAAMDKNKSIDLMHLVEPKEDSIAKEKQKVDKKADNKNQALLRAKMGAFHLNSAKVHFNDKSVNGASELVLDKIDAVVTDIDSKRDSLIKYDIAMRVNNGGKIKSNGNIKRSPIEQNGKIELQRVALKEITPYLQKNTFLKISEGFLSLKSDVSFRESQEKPYIRANGNMKVEDFFLQDSRDNSIITSFVKTDVKSFQFNNTSNYLEIDEVTLDSFYLDAMIDENKTINLAKLMKDQNSTKKEQTNSKADANESNQVDFSYMLWRFRVLNGSAKFADYSLPLDFKTLMHSLNGDVYIISNKPNEITFVDIDGMVDDYGSTKLQGSFKSSNIKSFMDIDFNFKNLDLNSLSGYSAQFAGYKIDKGKLYLDLKYKIESSQLMSQNNILIKNIELGDEIEDENITKLPLGLAIVLLEDSDGVIDISMPVEGNVDQPDFKYGALIFKAFVNLIGKAIASPFKFLGKALGISADELEDIEFEAGEFAILPPEREKLDNLVQILEKKPSLSLFIAPSYDAIKDKDALGLLKLKKIVLEKTKQEHATIEILEEIYKQTNSEENLKNIKDVIKKNYKEEQFSNEYRKILIKECVNAQNVTIDELKELATMREKTITEYLVLTKGLESQKIIIDNINEINDAESSLIKTKLNVNVR